MSKGNNGKGNNPERDLWQTSQKLFKILNNQYKFKFDCCANSNNSKCSNFSDNFQNVVNVKGVCWMNPPFSKARQMFEHFFKVVKKGVAIYRCDNFETKIWREIIFPNASWVFIPKGRVSYTPFKINIRKGGSRFPSALIGLNLPYINFLKGTILNKKVVKNV